jgi:hypothetical protein
MNQQILAFLVLMAGNKAPVFNIGLPFGRFEDKRGWSNLELLC